MNFDLKKPCDQCPFRADAPCFHLRQGRAQGIVDSLDEGMPFQCHKTDKTNAQSCAGSMISLKCEQGGFSGLLSVACAAKLLDYAALDMTSETLGLEEFVKHHEN